MGLEEITLQIDLLYAALAQLTDQNAAQVGYRAFSGILGLPGDE
jgi:hypothetical protein